MTYACLIDGPDWWGDPSMSPHGRPVPLEDASERAERRMSAEVERDALEVAVAALPDGCLVIHTAGRGAGALAGSEAFRRGLPLASWPPWHGPNGVGDRNVAIVAALVGLRDSGWTVKAIVAYTPDAACPDQHELADLVRSHGIHVRFLTAEEDAAVE